MKPGLNFDVTDFENWKKERAYKLHDLVMGMFISTIDMDSIVHNIARELLLEAGHTEAALNIFEELCRGGKGAS